MLKSSHESGAEQSGWSSALPVTLGAAKGPPVHDTDRSPFAEIEPLVGVAASALCRAVMPPASSARAPRLARAPRAGVDSKDNGQALQHGRTAPPSPSQRRTSPCATPETSPNPGPDQSGGSAGETRSAQDS